MINTPNNNLSNHSLTNIIHKSKNNNLNSLKIGSLNTRGLNEPTKLKCLLQYTTDNNYSIFGLSETKIKTSSQTHYKSKHFITNWSSNESSKAGVALIINNELYKHHFKTTSFNGYIISAFFKFKPKITLCITQTYIPHDKTNKQLTLNKLKELIQQNQSNNYIHIIIGDFNSTPNPKIDILSISKTQKQKKQTNKKLYNLLHNYSDFFRTLHPHKINFTYEGPTQKSRIDQIWISNNIIDNLTNTKIIPTNSEFQSDHKITNIHLESFFLHNRNTRNKKPTIIKYEYHKVNNETWDKINTNLSQQITSIISTTNINTQNL